MKDIARWWFCCLLAAVAAGTGLVVLAGWQWDIDGLKRPVPGTAAMNPLTALCFVLAGAGLILVRAGHVLAGRLAAGLTVLLCLGRLAGMLPGVGIDVDGVLYGAKIQRDIAAGLSSHMAVNTAVAFVLSGTGIWLLRYVDGRGRMPAHVLAVTVFGFGFFSLLGYLYRVPEFYSLLRQLPMAVHTAVCFVLLSAAMLLAERDKGLTREFTRPLAGALVGRVLVASVFIIPLMLGVVRLYVLGRNRFSPELGTTFLVLSLIIFFSAILLYTVMVLNRKDAQQQEAEAALRESRDLLNNFNQELERLVAEKTGQLEETTGQLRQLSSYLQTAREEERKYIAREIHDELGQMLTGLRMDVVWLRKRMENGDEAVRERFEGTMALLNETKQTMRRIATDLHPVLLDDLGLGAALTAQSREFERRSGIKTTFDTDSVDEAVVTQEMAICMYRIFQESLTNIARHAAATEVHAYIKQEAGQLVMGIADNGRGFDLQQAAAKKTLGLVSIRERALMVDGVISIQSAAGRGTEILLTIPIKQR